MPGRLTDAAAVAALATLLTCALAAMVLWKPSDRLFGMDIVGRHHDPFTVMEQFRRPVSFAPYAQPITDLPGAIAGRLLGVVAAYNWVVLLTFPLSAAATYLLARHLALSKAAATAAALAYAFSPFHLAQSAYHVHVAQTQWIPLYLLALWRCLDDPSWRAITLLAAATTAVTLSNLYAGLIMAVTTPLAGGAYWWVTRHAGRRPLRRLAITAGSMVLIAGVTLGYLGAIREATADPAALMFPRADLFRYSAKWWGYLVPPVASPLFGGLAREVWTKAGVREGLLEQQVSLGWGVIALGLVAVFAWSFSRRPLPARDESLATFDERCIRGAGVAPHSNTDGILARRALAARRIARLGAPRDFHHGLVPARRYVPMLVMLAAFGVVCSLSPERMIGAFTFVRPAALLYTVAPMFRSYARFGVIVQLMAALLAGIGIDWLRRVGSRPAHLLGVGLAALVVAEYAVLPSRMWRDVLPTKAHRWTMQQAGPLQALDCTSLDQESVSVQQLTDERVRLLGGPIPNCTDAHLPEMLAANGFTHLLVRRRTAIGRRFTERPVPDGLRLAARFNDALVFTVTAPSPLVYTAGMRGVSAADSDADMEPRRMDAAASWTVVNTTARPLQVTLSVELSASRPTRLDVGLDDVAVQTVVVDQSWHIRQLGPFFLSPGHHDLTFRAVDGATRHRGIETSGNLPPVTFALGDWTWAARGGQP